MALSDYLNPYAKKQLEKNAPLVKALNAPAQKILAAPPKKVVLPKAKPKTTTLPAGKKPSPFVVPNIAASKPTLAAFFNVPTQAKKLPTSSIATPTPSAVKAPAPFIVPKIAASKPTLAKYFSTEAKNAIVTSNTPAVKKPSIIEKLKSAAQIIPKIPKAVWEIERSPLQSIAQIGLYGEKKLEKTPSASYEPTSKLGKLFLGDKLSDFETSGQETLNAIGGIGGLKERGLDENFSKKWGFAFGGALVFSDLIPGGSAKNKIAKEGLEFLRTTNDIKTVSKVLKSSGLADDVIAPFAKTIAGTSDIKVVEKAVKEVDNLSKIKPKTIYHGTDKVFKDFDVRKTPDGSIWFTDNKSSITKGESGASGTKRIIERVIDENNLKLANWDEYDKYSLQQLQEMGFDGAKLPENGKVDYQIFYPEKLSIKKSANKPKNFGLGIEEDTRFMNTAKTSQKTTAQNALRGVESGKGDYHTLVNTGNGGINFTKAINAKPVENNLGLDLFVSKNKDGLWVVSEARSGKALTRPYKTKGEAINGIEDTIKTAKERGFDINNTIEKSISEDGLSPRYVKSENKVIAELPKKASSTVPQGKVITETVPEKAMKMKVFKDEKTAEAVMEIKSQVKEIGKKQFPGFEIPAETKRELLQRKLQDKMNRLGVVQKEIKKAGGKIEEASDAYLQQELFYGRAGNAIKSFEDDFVVPFVKKAKDNKVTIDELGDYLYAKHAVERNAKISEINPDILKGGSGMSNEEAAAILKGFKDSGKSIKLEELAGEFYDNVTKKRLQILRESGLEKSEALDLLEQGYRNYVPLKGKAGKESKAGIGQGFSVTGKDIKRAFGRESKADNPFVQSVLDYQETLIRAEKNKVSQSFLKLVEDNPNPNLWEVESLKYTPKYDKMGEVVSLDPHFKFADNVLQVKVDGKIKMITIKDEKLANAMKNLGVERGINQLNTINGYLRAINTTLNPEFIISNFERDIQTASINIGGEQSAKMAANTIKNTPKAMRGIWNNVRKGDKTGEWSKIYEELKQEGGKTGFFDMKSLDEKKKQLESSIKLYGSSKTSDKLKSTVKAAGEYIDNANEMVEMAVRTSAYKEAMANGMSKSQAASLAKNLTVNFNKKGEYGPLFNSLYLFSNAGVQGSARVLTALKHKKVRYIVGGIAAGTFALDEYNRNVNEQEYKKISDYEKNSNLIIMRPDGNHFKIALPYGFNIFKIMGDIGNDVAHKDINPEDAGKRFLLALDDVYNPLSSGSVNQLISPTVTDPIVQIAENKNFAGSPIKPDQPMFGANRKNSSLYWDSVRPQTKAVTDWLNRITGGSEMEAGYLDISPENLDSISDNLMGSVGKFIINAVSSGSTIAKGETPSLDNIPVVRKFVAGPNEYWATTTLREIKDKSGMKELTDVDTKKFKEAIKDGMKNGKLSDEDAVKAFKEVWGNQTKLKAGRVFTKLENATSEEKKAAVKDLTPEEIAALIKIIKDKAKE